MALALADPQYVGRQVLAWCLIVVGTFLLARSVVLQGPRSTMRELMGLRTERLRPFKNHVIQRLEAAFGFLFVTLGAVIHVYVLLRGSIDVQAKDAYLDVLKVLGGAVLAMVGLLAGIRWFCSWLSRRIFVRHVAYLVARHAYRIEDDQALLKELGEVMGIPRTEDDTVESYAQRIEAGLRLDEVRERVRPGPR